MTNHTPYWTRVCLEGIERKKNGLKPFTRQQKILARSWVTCACAKQDPRIPRGNGGDPLDPLLKVLGCQFTEAVIDGRPAVALSRLDQIELRGAEVVAEVGG